MQTRYCGLTRASIFVKILNITMDTKHEYWKLVLDSLQKTIPSTHFNAWFSRLVFLSTENLGTTIKLATFSTFAQRYIEGKYKTQLINTINKYYPKVRLLEFVIDPKLIQSKPKSKPQNQPNQNQEIQFQNFSSKEPQPLINLLHPKAIGHNLNNLNPKYTFDTLVCNHSNELATCVAKIICDKPGTQYNPVFLYAGTGLGKTHILQAIGQKTLELHPNFNIKYITSESFVSQYIEAVTSRKIKDFNDYFRSIDLLLVDDIHFIAGKEGTQEAFFHIFNILHQHNKQIVVSSDKHPKNLGAMEERLISRFEWGIVIDISKPNLEDRLLVIQAKVRKMLLPINQSQMEIIASTVDTNYRDIEGVLNRIQARMQLLPDKPITSVELNQILQSFNLTSLIKIDFTPLITSFDQILELVAMSINIDSRMIMSKNREKKINIARQLTMYVLKQDLNYSYASISQLFDKSRSTVMHSIEKITQEVQSNPIISDYVNIIRQSYPKTNRPK